MARLNKRDQHIGARSPVNRDELLLLAVQVGSIGIFESDLVEKQTHFSPELCTILGLPAGTEMTYAQAARVIDERDRAGVQERVEAARTAADRGKWNGVFRVSRTDGAVRWVSVHGRRIYQDTSVGLQPVRSIGTVIDITHLKENEAALHESELRLRLALDAAQMGTFEADVSACEAHIDVQEARLLGLPEDTRVVSIEEMRKRIPIDDLSVSDSKQDRMNRRVEAYHHEFRLGMPNGSQRWLSAYADIRSSRIFGVNFDITQQKLAEAALRESEERLRVATNAAALGVYEWDPKEDRAIWENERMYQIFGRARADGPLTRKEFVDGYLHRDDAPTFEGRLEHGDADRELLYDLSHQAKRRWPALVAD